MNIREGLKTAMLILLTVTMLALFFATWAYSLGAEDGGLSLFLLKEPPADGDEEQTPAVSRAASPIQAAANAGNGLYGACGGFGEVEALYERARTVLAEAIGSAGEFAPVSDGQLEEALSGNLIFFLYDGRVPLFLIGQWLGVSTRSGPDILAGAVVLSLREEGVMLYCRDAESGEVYGAATAALPESLISAAEPFSANGCMFAAADRKIYPMLRPETLVFPSAPVLPKLSASDAPDISNKKYVQTILSAFDYNPYTVRKYLELDGSQVYVGEENTLQIYPGGDIRFLAPDPAYGLAIPGLPADDGRRGVAYMVEKTRALAETVTQSLSGDASLGFSGYSYDEADDTYTLFFDYRSQNIPVLSEDKGHAFSAGISKGRIYEVTCALRNFQKTEDVSYLMPPRQAAAAILPGREASKTSMLVCYRGDESGVFRAGWNYGGAG